MEITGMIDQMNWTTINNLITNINEMEIKTKNQILNWFGGKKVTKYHFNLHVLKLLYYQFSNYSVAAKIFQPKNEIRV